MGFVSHVPSRQPGLGCLLFRSSPLSLNLAMASAGLQILGIILTLLGWVNALVSCALPLWKDLQAARALCVVALLLALLGLLVYLAGAKCTTCVEDKDSKARLVLVSGIIFVISGVLTLIPVCWTAHTIIRDFYNPLVAEAQKRELGASLYLGWAASGLLLLGGGLLCCTCPSGGARGSNHYMARYSASAAHGTSQGPSEYPAKNYV
ncbi:claudin-6 isoform X4 [Acinonyx jubatus]|uniref:Claudin-6 isoform X4 n=1 Tax=Acinonyx jubatus TaxID=32536 RepID=A0ABM3PC99_ACIJB|nr:claudin-6 isoform X6 [Felis catus]XP_053069302.1 claudin-6 isoform X4 [Acinonyx jubatus]